MNSQRFAARPNCIYCGKPVERSAWDEESQGWFSYGYTCMSDHSDGRYAVKQVDPSGEKIVRRFANLKRAQGVAAQYAQWNPHLRATMSWTAVDLGAGTTHECQWDD